MRDWRSGSLRERRPGVWEIRVAVANDPITGRAIQRSFTFHGHRVGAEARCAELAADYAAHRATTLAAPFVTVDDVLDRWLSGDHDWRPSTWSGYRSNARALCADPIAGLRVARIDSLTVRAAIGRWRLFDPVGHYHRPDVFQLSVDTRPQRAVTIAADERVDPGK